MAKITQIKGISKANLRDYVEAKTVTARQGKSAQLQANLKEAKKAGKLVKKETIGGITTETIESKDGHQWQFAYRAENNVISAALSAENPTRLAQSLTL